MTSPVSRRLLVLAAMPLELRPFRRRLGLGPVEGPAGVPPLAGGRLGARTEVVAGTTGVGPAAAHRVATALLGWQTFDRVVMLGIAGGLDPGLEVGDLVVPAVVEDEATGAEVHPAPALGHATAGRLLTCDRILTDPEELAAHRRRGVTALDMETAAVGAAAQRAGCEWTALRALSDVVRDGLVTTDTLAMTRPDGTTDPVAAARALVAHPGRIPGLLRLGRDTGRAVAVVTEAGLRECRAAGG